MPKTFITMMFYLVSVTTVFVEKHNKYVYVQSS